MSIDDFKDLGKSILNNKVLNDIVSDFTKELSKELEKNSNKIEEGTVCVVTDYNDEKITLLNPDDGKEFDVYIATSDEVMQKLQNQGIDSSNIYNMDKKEFYNLDIGTKLKLNNRNYQTYEGEIDIKDSNAKYKIEEMNMYIQEDEGKNFIVKDIKDNKIYLTDENGSGYFSIYKELYPELAEGDTVKKVEGKYKKI